MLILINTFVIEFKMSMSLTTVKDDYEYLILEDDKFGQNK